MWDKGTNLHHALLLANRHFRKHPDAQPVLLIVTDGEPTSHLAADGEVFFSYPPHPMTIAATVGELDTSMRLGAQTTFFRLGDDPGLARFVDSMAKRAGGRVVAPEARRPRRRRGGLLPRLARVGADGRPRQRPRQLVRRSGVLGRRLSGRRVVVPAAPGESGSRVLEPLPRRSAPAVVFRLWVACGQAAMTRHPEWRQDRAITGMHGVCAWRNRWDLNPRWAQHPHNFSRVAPSAARTRFRGRVYCMSRRPPNACRRPASVEA